MLSAGLEMHAVYTMMSKVNSGSHSWWSDPKINFSRALSP